MKSFFFFKEVINKLWKFLIVKLGKKNKLNQHIVKDIKFLLMIGNTNID